MVVRNLQFGGASIQLTMMWRFTALGMPSRFGAKTVAAIGTWWIPIVNMD